MEISEVWLLIVAVAAPTAGTVAFAIQLRILRKLHLENTKLQLEIAELKAKQKMAVSRLTIASPAETERYGRPPNLSSHIFKHDDSPQRQISQLEKGIKPLTWRYIALALSGVFVILITVFFVYNFLLT